MECVPRQAVNPNLSNQSAAGTSPPSTQIAPSGSTPAAPVPAATASVATSTAPTSTATVACQNVVTIPVPIVSQEDIYTYVSIKGSLHDRTCALFGLNDAEVLALSKRFDNGSTQIVNGVMINAPPMQIINTLSQLGYKVVCSTGEAEIVWTMQREV